MPKTIVDVGTQLFLNLCSKLSMYGYQVENMAVGLNILC